MELWNQRGQNIVTLTVYGDNNENIINTFFLHALEFSFYFHLIQFSCHRSHADLVDAKNEYISVYN